MFTEVSESNFSHGISLSFRKDAGIIIGPYWLIRDPNIKSPDNISIRIFNLAEGTLEPSSILLRNQVYTMDAIPDSRFKVYTARHHTNVRVAAPPDIRILREELFLKSLQPLNGQTLTSHDQPTSLPYVKTRP